MRAEAQLPLDLQHRPAMGREDYLVTPCNELAVAWIDRWPDWPAPALALYGPAGCGKSHLAEVWRERSGARHVAADALLAGSASELLAMGSLLIVEDLELGLADSPALQEALFHLYNALKDQGGHLLLTGRQAPARWVCPLADLRSRLGSLPAVALEAPDEGLMEALLLKLFVDRQLRVTPEVLRYIVVRIERSFEAASLLVARIDQVSLARRRPVTIPLLRDLLAEAHTPGQTDASQSPK